MSAPETPAPVLRLPWPTRVAMFARLLAIQGSWNYELLLGPGIGFCAEPALRELPGGRGGEAYRDALARQSRYFNAHPYLAAVAVGALARAELERQAPARIERFRTALCGPLGSLGDRLVWAGWLPFCSLLALTAFGLGAPPAAVTLLFFGTYNAGHLGLRAWGLGVGWRRGMRVAPALGTPVLRHGPTHIARAVALLSGVALPLVLHRTLQARGGVLGGAAAAAVLVAAMLVRLHGRVEGWRVALSVLAVSLAVLAIFTLTR